MSATTTGNPVDGIVIVGLACRFPDADDPGQLWRSVLSRRRSFRPLPPRRLPLHDYGGEGVDQTYLTRAAVLEGWQFDRAAFRISRESFRAADPAHWLALEVSAAALRDAGLPHGEGTDRDRVGVVLGNSLTGEFSRASTVRMRWPYIRRMVAAALDAADVATADRSAVLDDLEQRVKSPFAVPTDESLAGALANTIAGRVCNYFDFHGTGYTVDAACASSLVAVATAADAIVSGQLDVALAGGVDLSLDPLELVGFSRVGALARGEMRVYDADPTGFLPGEGCGIVVLCRSSFAAAHGLRVYARLAGWATSSDGSGGLTRPEASGQRLALARAYRRAGIDPGQVELIEGHGTGTAVGDATELRTLLDVRGDTPTRAALGTIKANIGHTKAAAGVAGLIKVALAVHRQVVPPTTGVARSHPLVAAPGASVELLDDARPWRTDDRYAAVNAMGFGGINAHVVLAGATPTTRRALSRLEQQLTTRHPDYEVVVCAAPNLDELDQELAVLRTAAATLSGAELTDLAAAQAARTHSGLPFRFAVAVRSAEELTSVLEEARRRIDAGDRNILDPDRRLFLCSGPALRISLLLSGQAAPVRAGGGALAPLLGELPGAYADRLPDSAGDPPDTAVAQPAILRASLAGLRWLDALGVHATAATGHSLGELAALVWAGALTEEDAYTLVKDRARAMASAGQAPSAMAGLGAGFDTATGLIAGTGAVVAADNAPDQVVVSGYREQVDAVLAAARTHGIAGHRLPVSAGFHSPVMAPAREPLRAAARRVTWRRPQRPLVSTVTGDWWNGSEPVDVLVRQLTEPVRFREALQRLPGDLLIEVGPGSILSRLAGRPAVSLDVGAESAVGVATATAALFAAGACDDVQAYFGRRATRSFDPAAPRRFLANPCETDVSEPAATALDGAGDRAAPTVPTVTSADPLEATIGLVADVVGLDRAAVTPGSRLLADLHLTSLRVGQLANQVAGALGRAVPREPLSLATATVADFAGVIGGLPPAGADEPGPPAGVASWVRVFGHHLEARPHDRPDRLERAWTIVGEAVTHPHADRLRAAFRPVPGAAPARLLALPPGLDPVPAEIVAEALRSCDADGRPLVVVHSRGIGAAVGRSLVAERPEIPVLVVDVPAGAAGIDLAAAEAHRHWDGYAEVIFDAGGGRTEPVVRPLVAAAHEDTVRMLATDHVCLVTGGAKGIGAECAVALAEATGATMVLLGRSPADDADVRSTLNRIPKAIYRQVDVTDRDAVADTLAEVRSEAGPIRMLLHAAGTNEPGALRDLTADRIRRTLAAKTDGWENLLDALDRSELRCAVTFGSIIGTIGLPGEADYAIANEWLARRCAELAATAPATRWLNIEWSAWAGVGMGARLGVLDTLARKGLGLIPVDAGADMLMRLLATPELPPTVLVCGRLPDTPTLRRPAADVEPRRFLETRSVTFPGIEIVADATVSLGADPYLDDHRLDGLPVLPAVLGLEAMAQAAAALGATTVPGVFDDVRLVTPITVPERADRVVRTAALAGENGVDVVVRSDESSFAVDHFSARLDGPPSTVPAATGATPGGPLLQGLPLYGPLFFHGERFRRVEGYAALSPYRCSARVVARDGRWFGGFQPQRLELGDPAARDAVLHLLQACVPDRRVLPVGVRRLVVHRRPAGLLSVDARQRTEDGDDFVFDLVVRDDDGAPVEEWHGLALRAVGPLPYGRLPIGAIGAHLTRSLRRWHPGTSLNLAVAAGARSDRQRAVEVATWLGGRPVTRAADGRLVSPGGGVSASHLSGRLLVATGAPGTAVDWESAGQPPALPPATAAVAAALARLTAEDEARSATRAWTCREVLSKQGWPGTAPLVVEARGPDGWVLLRSGASTLCSTVVDTLEGPVAVAVGTGDLDA
ncbi:SDR family NAD(P)-dependent oxidoreductase [Actinoplanes bogorensis]|uniref:SDR family NAD(P)-dependent oxidoreductase n=1 Tax=Paractinoplanes bogorensis TaxID=1610840 RepID=A0ABS5YUZ1_9ACTN|nr:type I polyketide synthase [Actinoplanes bogorensis]MBU2667267.1 SDR family NAD(P)-dependent oxidoreductase [Actinoplanes bogorensis]